MHAKSAYNARATRLPMYRTAACWTVFLSACLLAACAASFGAGDGDWPAAAGAPVAEGRDLRRLVNDGFTIGYDQARRRAAWVAYRVTPLAGYRHLSRPDFAPDPRLAATNADRRRYAGRTYDRGHLAPNYAISQLYGEAAQRETFYYSNIAPQRPRLNQLVWQRLEEIEIDDIAPRVDTLWVVVGPVPGEDGGPPVAFFRLWLAHTAGSGWQAMAFRVPQSVRGDERLDDFIVSVDRIEADTGLDFLAGLGADRQRALEARPASAKLFDFAEFACQPARYGKRWRDRDGIHLRYDRCDAPGS